MVIQRSDKAKKARRYKTAAEDVSTRVITGRLCLVSLIRPFRGSLFRQIMLADVTSARVYIDVKKEAPRLFL